MHSDEHLSRTAQDLGAWMTRQSSDGLPGHVDVEKMVAAFPDLDIKELKLALAELKAAGLIELSSAINRPVPSVRTTVALFDAADPAVTGYSPRKDAVVLARMIIENPRLGHIPDLEKAAAWPRRRLNPAVGLLVPLFPPTRMRNPLQNAYPLLSFIVGDDEIITLKRFVRDETR